MTISAIAAALAFDKTVRDGYAHENQELFDCAMRLEAVVAERDETIRRLDDSRMGCLASLVAAVDLLERAHKAGTPPAQVVASDKMFEQMLKDYGRAIDEGRAALSIPLQVAHV